MTTTELLSVDVSGGGKKIQIKEAKNNRTQARARRIQAKGGVVLSQKEWLCTVNCLRFC